MSSEKQGKQVSCSNQKCKKKVDKVLLCKGCPAKRCLKCAGVEESKFETLSKNFFCEQCSKEELLQVMLKRLELLEGEGRVKEQDMKNMEKRVAALEKEKKDMEKRMVGVEKEKEELGKQLERLQGRVSELEKKQTGGGGDTEKVEKMVKETVQRETTSFAEALKKDLKERPGKVAVVEQVAEMQDRRYNVVFRGVEESEEEDSGERKKADIEAVIQIARRVGVEEAVMAEAISTARRLGRKEEGKNKRPMLIRLKSLELRDKLLARSKNLRTYNEENKTKFRIDPDLTKDQMKNLDNLWEEARRKSKNGMKFYVAGMENPVLRQSREERVSAKDH